MKDRYLFKAKRVEGGNWVCGALIHHPYGTCIGSVDNDGLHELYIDSDTICQCTGLTDKNGKQIWESDIIHIGDKSIPYIVEWHDTGFKGKAVHAMDMIGLKYWSAQIEVIGNKFDNPELLEVEDE